VSCSEGETGYVYNGELDFEIKRSEVDELPMLPTKVMMNVVTQIVPSTSLKSRTKGLALLVLNSSSTR